MWILTSETPQRSLRRGHPSRRLAVDFIIGEVAEDDRTGEFVGSEEMKVPAPESLARYADVGRGVDKIVVEMKLALSSTSNDAASKDVSTPSAAGCHASSRCRCSKLLGDRIHIRCRRRHRGWGGERPGSRS